QRDRSYSATSETRAKKGLPYADLWDQQKSGGKASGNTAESIHYIKAADIGFRSALLMTGFPHGPYRHRKQRSHNQTSRQDNSCGDAQLTPKEAASAERISPPYKEVVIQLRKAVVIKAL